MATFFVTNQFPGYQGMIAKEAAAGIPGHCLGLHGAAADDEGGSLGHVEAGGTGGGGAAAE